MSGSVTICQIPDDLKKQLRDFRFKHSECSIEEIQDELPDQQPRFVVISYELKHSDGRVSFPLCLLFYSPFGCSTELQILYAGSRNHLVNACDLRKNAEVREIEEITKEFLDSKFS
uniref:ADF-H domain-containing protein n=1 Tax=Panagrolaimus sp. PS1159 TaxID=55785 RepID=A0AC35FA57_9BILA